MSALPVVDVRSRIVSDTTAAYLPPSGRLGRTRVALVTVIEEEFAAAQDVFGLNENLCGTGYFAAEPAASGVSDVVLMQATDRSNVPVMGGCFGADGGTATQVIILLGIAGGLCDEDGRGRDGIRPGDVLIADQVGYVEFLKIVPGGPLVRTYANRSSFRFSSQVGERTDPKDLPDWRSCARHGTPRTRTIQDPHWQHCFGREGLR